MLRNVFTFFEFTLIIRYAESVILKDMVAARLMEVVTGLKMLISYFMFQQLKQIDVRFSLDLMIFYRLFYLGNKGATVAYPG